MENKEKLNLSKGAVTHYWRDLDPRMAKILSVMEHVEHWVVDENPPVATEIINLGKSITKASKEVLNRESDELMQIMAYVSSSKAIRLLNWLDDNYPGLSFQYTMNARQMDELDSARLFLDRLRTLKNLQLLGKVFAPSRTRLISEILKEREPDDD